MHHRGDPPGPVLPAQGGWLRDVPLLWGGIGLLACVAFAQAVYIVQEAREAAAGNDSSYRPASGSTFDEVLLSVDARLRPDDLSGILSALLGWTSTFAEEHHLPPRTTLVLQGFVEEHVSTVNTLQAAYLAGLQSPEKVEEYLATERLRAVMGTSILLGQELGVQFEADLHQQWLAAWARVQAGSVPGGAGDRP